MRKKDSFISKGLVFMLGGLVAVVLGGHGIAWAITNEFSDHVNILDDKAVQLGTDLDIQISYDETTDNRMEITDGTNLLWHLTDAGTTGNTVTTGISVVNGTTNLIGAVNLGTAATTKGILTLEREAALNGYMQMVSSDGTDLFIFADNAGNLRKHTAAPTADGDGLQFATGSLNNVVEDTTPQLGGNLDVNGNSIVSASAGDIAITPDTTGDVILDGLKWPQADGTAAFVLSTDGAAQLSWVAAAGSGAIANVVEDTTPQLGGALDVNGKEITGAIDLHSTADVILELGDAIGANEVSIRDSAAAEVAIITSDGEIGLNTSTPAQQVHVFSNTANAVGIRLENSEGRGEILVDGTFLSFWGTADDELMRLQTNSIKFLQPPVGNTDGATDLGASVNTWNTTYTDAIVAHETVVLGVDGVTQGLQTIFNGAGTTPGTLRLESSDGTSWNFFVTNAGILNRHTALPSSDSDGSSVDGSATELASDLSPELGADLNLAGFTITGEASNKDVTIEAFTSGSVILDGVNWPQSDGSANETLTTNGAGQTFWSNQAAGIASVAADTTPQLGGDLDVNGSDIVSASAGDITITPDTTGEIVLDAQKWPQADGTASQVLKTDGAGQLSWTTSAAGGTGRFVTLYLSDQLDTTISTGTAKVTWRAPFAITLTGVRAGLKGASSSGLPTVDINEGGVTVLSTKLTIDASELTSTTAATAAVISDANLADDAEITFDIDVAGTGADGLFVTLLYDKT